ncbi:MAG: hypothetical protein JRN39_05225 [Nitrososphaerota archaeon]|nr:hypothetical protein [Nitrososphaerota archaeon]
MKPRYLVPVNCAAAVAFIALPLLSGVAYGAALLGAVSLALAVASALPPLRRTGRLLHSGSSVMLASGCLSTAYMAYSSYSLFRSTSFLSLFAAFLLAGAFFLGLTVLPFAGS